MFFFFAFGIILVSRNHNGRRLILSQFVHGYNYTRIWYIISKVHGSRVLYKYVARSFSIFWRVPIYITRTHLCTHSSHAHSKNPLATNCFLSRPNFSSNYDHVPFSLSLSLSLFNFWLWKQFTRNHTARWLSYLNLCTVQSSQSSTRASRLYKRDASIHVYVRVINYMRCYLARGHTLHILCLN